MSRVGKRVQEERIKKGMTPKQLGKKCGVSESFILDVESGKKIINDKLFGKISNVLGGNLEENMMLQASSEEDNKQEETIQRKTQDPVKPTLLKRKEVEPLAQWGEAFSNIIKQVPIYDLEMTTIKSYKSFPIIDKKVEGFHPDKLIYVELEDDTLQQYRMKKGDQCLIYLNHEIINNSFQLVEYDNKRYLRKIKKVDGNNVQLIAGVQDGKAILKNPKDIKVLGRLIRVEIDFQ
ncbi:MAG: helix-turn-helix transcriptional regulator [Clostridiaceae bacterium]|nr:helix-turn-helix transcriptional regulator [Clostridiaceae bacterium]